MIVVAIKLSDHFTYGRLVRFALPSIAMMIFTSIYSVVDGLFVSNFAGKEALAAVNLVFPLAMALGSIGTSSYIGNCSGFSYTAFSACNDNDFTHFF